MLLSPLRVSCRIFLCSCCEWILRGVEFKCCGEVKGVRMNNFLLSGGARVCMYVDRFISLLTLSSINLLLVMVAPSCISVRSVGR